MPPTLPCRTARVPSETSLRDESHAYDAKAWSMWGLHPDVDILEGDLGDVTRRRAWVRFRASRIRAGSYTSAGRRARFCEQRETSVPARRASWHVIVVEVACPEDPYLT